MVAVGRIVQRTALVHDAHQRALAVDHDPRYVVEAMSDCLRLETRPFGIDVVVIEPGALVTALKTGRPGMAAVDVFEQEPVTDLQHPLLNMNNVVCTPHLGYVERDQLERYYNDQFTRVLAFAKGAPVDVANPQALGVVEIGQLALGVHGARLDRGARHFVEISPGAEIPGLRACDDEALDARIGAPYPPGELGDLMAVVDGTAVAVQAMKAGAIEFLSKPFREADLLRTIEDALRLDSQQHIQRAERAEWRQRYASLTRREHEVLHLIVAGRLNKQIAAELGVSEVTVKLHRAQVMRKMGQDTLADLVRGMTRLGEGERTTGVHPDTPPPAPPYTKV